MTKEPFLDVRDSVGDRPLSVACRCGHVAAVRKLLDRGSPLYQKHQATSRSDSPPCLAAMSDHLPVVSLLLERGASASKKDETGWQPFRYAAYHGHLDVRYLLYVNPNRILPGGSLVGPQLEKNHQCRTPSFLGKSLSFPLKFPRGLREYRLAARDLEALPLEIRQCRHIIIVKRVAFPEQFLGVKVSFRLRGPRSRLNVLKIPLRIPQTQIRTRRLQYTRHLKEI